MRHTKKMARQAYFVQYPNALKKWVNTCICCGKSGYKPDMPDMITVRGYGKPDHETLIAKNIRYYYTPMAVDELGRCDECRNAAEKAHKRKED